MLSEFLLEPDADGILVLTARGLMTIDQADTLLARLETESARLRQTFGRVRLLVDARNAIVQPSDVTKRLEAAAAISSCGDDDRVATIVASALLRLQIGRLGHFERQRLFADEAAARAWLAE